MPSIVGAIQSEGLIGGERVGSYSNILFSIGMKFNNKLLIDQNNYP